MFIRIHSWLKTSDLFSDIICFLISSVFLYLSGKGRPPLAGVEGLFFPKIRTQKPSLPSNIFEIIFAGRDKTSGLYSPEDPILILNIFISATFYILTD